IVVEAPVGSGALITARDAGDLNREVGVILGRIDSPQSAGTNLLMRDGAHPITSIDDALMLAGLPPQRRNAPNIDDPFEMQVWDALKSGAVSLDELCTRSNLPVAQCLTAVTGLEL